VELAGEGPVGFGLGEFLEGVHNLGINWFMRSGPEAGEELVWRDGPLGAGEVVHGVY
jgi:hypothetical protein